MKEIFDWLREQFGKIIGEVHSPADVVWNNAVKMCITKVDEAEAKWKEDCCEWKWGIGSAHVQCQGDRIIFDSRRLFTYCPYCGKKISEVE